MSSALSEMTRRTGRITPDRGIPIPPAAERPGMVRIYPWDEMRVGDSFELKSKTSSPPPRLKDAGWKFVVRRWGSSYRCWRIA